MELQERRQLISGTNDAFVRAAELVVTPFVLAGLGFLLDRWLGTGRVFAFLLGALAIAGTFAKLAITYSAEMRAHEESAPWRRRIEQSGDAGEPQ